MNESTMKVYKEKDRSTYCSCYDDNDCRGGVIGYSRCNGTREREICNCHGNPAECNFYEKEVKEKYLKFLGQIPTEKRKEYKKIYRVKFIYIPDELKDIYNGDILLAEDKLEEWRKKSDGFKFIELVGYLVT